MPVIATLLSLLDIGTEEAIQEVYRQMRSISTEDVMVLAERGFLLRIARFLTPDNNEMIRIVATIIIDSMLKRSKQLIRYARASAIFPLLNRMAADRNSSLAKASLDVLWDLSAKDESVKDILRHLGLISTLVMHIQNSSLQVQLSACGVLSNLALDSACCKQIMQAGGVKAVAGLLNIHDVPELHVRALSAMWNLTADAQCRQEAIDLGVANIVFSFLRSSNKAVEEKASGCFAEMALLSRAVRDSMRSTGVDLLLRKLLDYDGLEGKSDKAKFSMMLALACFVLERADEIGPIRCEKAYKLLRAFCRTSPCDHEFGWSWLSDEVHALNDLLCAPPSQAALQSFGAWTIHYVLRPDRLTSARDVVILAGVRGALMRLARSSDLDVRSHACSVLCLLGHTQTQPGLREDLLRWRTTCPERMDLFVDGLPVHSFVGYARSPLVRAVLQSNMMETRNNSIAILTPVLVGSSATSSTASSGRRAAAGAGAPSPVVPMPAEKRPRLRRQLSTETLEQDQRKRSVSEQRTVLQISKMKEKEVAEDGQRSRPVAVGETVEEPANRTGILTTGNAADCRQAVRQTVQFWYEDRFCPEREMAQPHAFRSPDVPVVIDATVDAAMLVLADCTSTPRLKMLLEEHCTTLMNDSTVAPLFILSKIAHAHRLEAACKEHVRQHGLLSGDVSRILSCQYIPGDRRFQHRAKRGKRQHSRSRGDRGANGKQSAGQLEEEREKAVEARGWEDLHHDAEGVEGGAGGGAVGQHEHRVGRIGEGYSDEEDSDEDGGSDDGQDEMEEDECASDDQYQAAGDSMQDVNGAGNDCDVGSGFASSSSTLMVPAEAVVAGAGTALGSAGEDPEVAAGYRNASLGCRRSLDGSSVVAAATSSNGSGSNSSRHSSGGGACVGGSRGRHRVDPFIFDEWIQELLESAPQVGIDPTMF